jgi:hypothetical protein
MSTRLGQSVEWNRAVAPASVDEWITCELPDESSVSVPTDTPAKPTEKIEMPCALMAAAVVIAAAEPP